MTNVTGTIQKNKGKIADSIHAHFRTYSMVIALAVIWILFSILTDGVFFEPRNLSNLVRQTALIAILAIGMVPVIVTGNIDLSVGSVVGIYQYNRGILPVFYIS